MQATAVTQATTVTPATSNIKDDNHDQSKQQEHKYGCHQKQGSLQISAAGNSIDGG
jgi:hypothetical protein